MTQLQVLEHPSWHIGAISQQGPGKAVDAVSCEDSFVVGSVGDSIYAVVADGVGSSAHAQQGSQKAVSQFQRALEFGLKRPNFCGTRFWSCFMAAHVGVAQVLPRESNAQPVAFATTLQAVALVDGKLHYGRVGDGGGVSRASKRVSFLGPPPEPGFVTKSIHETDWSENIEFFSVDAGDVTSIVLFSDGAEGYFTNGDDEITPNDDFFEHVVPFIRAAGNYQLPSLLVNMVMHDELPDDDRTVAVLIKRCAAKEESADDVEPAKNENDARGVSGGSRRQTGPWWDWYRGLRSILTE